MARENFASALSAVLKHEGGWADHPRDPGGATMKGVTLATYRRYRPRATKEELRNISDAELRRIYRDGYWDVIRGDDLPAGVDFAVFDFAVNSGPSRAAKFLQGIVGVPKDGLIGPVTLAAVRAANPEAIIRNLCDQRQAWLETLGTFATFGAGWTRRVSEVKAKAVDMLYAASIRQPDDPGVDTPPQSTKGHVGLVFALLAIAAALAAFFIFGR